jgi:N-acetylneuraminate synthase
MKMLEQHFVASLERRTFIIGEAGVNHNGDLTTALKMIDAAKGCDADAVKFQTWKTDNIIVPGTRKVDYQLESTGDGESQYGMLRRLELSYDDFDKLKQHCEEVDILFMSTPDDTESADFLDSLGVEIFKIGSGEITNMSLIERVAKKGRPIILSTGMASIEEIDGAVACLRQAGSQSFALLHCVSDYPANYADLNLRVINSLKDRYSVPIGFSDHSLGIEMPIAAVALGASIIEKHFTLDRSMTGPDHQCSLEVAEFRQMVRAIRNVEEALGDGIKRITATELRSRSLVRKVLVAARDIKAGEILDETMVLAKRAGKGIAASELAQVVGRTVQRDLRPNEILSSDILS